MPIPHLENTNATVQKHTQNILSPDSLRKQSSTTLKTLINSSQVPLIHKIPPELLSQIFATTLEDILSTSPICSFPAYFYANDTCKITFRNYTRLSHVCKYWREIMLSLPKLWSAIIFGAFHPDRAESVCKAFLSRSRHIPLRISLTCNVSSDCILLLKPELPRLKEIYIRTPDLLNSPNNLYHLVNSPAPSLETISIDVCEATLPMIFNGRLPSLKRLEIAAKHFGPNRFSMLSHLSLIGTVYWTTLYSAMNSQFYLLLKDCPTLEELHLGYPFAWLPSAAFHFQQITARERIQMHQLRRLTVSDCHPRHLKYILSILELPVHAAFSFYNIMVDTDNCRITDNIFGTITQNIHETRTLDTSHLRNIQDLTHLSLIIDTDLAHVIGYGPSGAFDIHACPFSSEVGAHLPEFSRFVYSQNLLGLGSLPLITRIKCLWLHGPHKGVGLPRNEHDFWTDILLNLPELEELYLTHWKTRWIISALGKEIAPSSSLIPCANLKMLSIYRDPSLHYQAISIMVQNRSEKFDSPIKKMAIQHPAGCRDMEVEDFLQQIQKYVEEVQYKSHTDMWPEIPVPEEYGRYRHKNWPSWKENCQRMQQYRRDSRDDLSAEDI
ncbi:hypothetical protein ABKN59_011360 [Abortiporus biennis]